MWNWKEFMQQRANWLRVMVQKEASGQFSIVIRIDGSYSHLGDAESMRDFWQQQVLEVIRNEGDKYVLEDM
jgi:hypothetical protein